MKSHKNIENGLLKAVRIPVILTIVLSGIVLAQPVEEWVARYNGPGNDFDFPNAIITDSSCNVYVTGYGYGGSGTGDDYVTIKYNSSGIEQWVACYTDTGYTEDKASSIAIDDSGNVYVTGFSGGIEVGTQDYATIKYNPSGIQQWVARYNGSANGDDYGRSVAVDDSGNVYVTGAGGGSRYGYVTIKYSPYGAEQWVARYNGGPADAGGGATSIALDDSGNIYVTGEIGDSAGTGPDFVTIKYNLSGVPQWVARYNGPANGWDDQPSETGAYHNIAVDDSGNVYVTGSSEGVGTGYDYATVKYNSSGIEQWVARYNGPGNGEDTPYAIVVDDSGNVYVTGLSTGLGTGWEAWDYATVKYNSSGIEQWVDRYNGPGNSMDFAVSIALDGLGNAYVTGLSVGSGTGWDYATIKYNSSGAEWVVRFQGPGDREDCASSIAVDGSGNIYVTGESWGSGTVGQDWMTVKYRQTGAVEEEPQQALQRFSLESHPNPFQSSTSIRYSVSIAGEVSLSVYDISGRMVKPLLSATRQKPGCYTVKWDGTDMMERRVNSGIYFLILQSSGKKIAKKIVALW